MLHVLPSRFSRPLFFLIALCAVLFPFQLSATLHPGDIAFVGMNTDGNNGDFAFVALRDLPPGEQIFFTDAGWKLPENEFRTGETWLGWNVTGNGVPAGTVVQLSLPGQLSNLGDQLIAFQGSFANPSIIAAMNNAGYGWQSTAENAEGSALPTGLANGKTAGAYPHIDNLVYDGPLYGTRSEILENIHNPIYWDGSNSYYQFFNFSFSIYSDYPYVHAGQYYTVAETDGSISITITSDQTGSHSATLQRVGGSASPGSDFNFSAQTVNFSSGRAQTVVIPITDDSDCELSETIELELICTSGVTPLTEHVQITITDDEAGHYSVAQGFENSPDDTWNFNHNPAQYNTEGGSTPLEISGQEAVWTPVITFGGDYWAPQGDLFWGMQDIDNNNGGGNFWHTLDFEPVDLSNVDAAAVNFRYFTFNSTSSDRIEFSIQYDNGTSWGNYQSLPTNTNGWRDTSLVVPPGAGHVRLRIRALETSGILCGGIDGVELEGIVCGSNNTLETGLVNTSFCVGGGAVAVPFTATGLYSPNNIFTAYLSDGTGDFTNATSLGSLSLSGIDPSGTIAGIIPTTIPAGTGYRIRVESSSPALVGTDNGVDIVLQTVSISATATPLTCSDSQDGSIDLALSGGSAPYTIQWTGPNGFTSTDEDLTGLDAGSYSVTVTDANGCSAQETISLTAPSLDLALNATDISCFGAGDGSISPQIQSGTAPFTYSWTGPNGFASNATSLSNLGAGLYTLLLTDANGCIDSASTTIVEPGELTASAQGVAINSCGNAIGCYQGSDGAINLTVTGGTSPFTYQWTGPNSFSSSASDPTGLPAGTYSVIITDANGCTAVSSAVLTEPLPLTGAIDANAYNCGYIISCHGESDGSLFAVGVGGGCPPYSYAWSNGDTDSIATGLSAGTYTLTITDGGGCEIIRSATIQDPPELTATVSVVPANCDDSNDGSIDMQVDGGCQPYTVTWTGPQGFVSNDISPDSLGRGHYTYTVVDGNGCTIDGYTNILTLNNVSATMGCCQDTVICAGASVDLAIETTGVGPFEVTYLQDGDTNTFIAGPGTNFLTLTPTEATTVELLTVTSLASGCTGEVCGRATIGVNDCGGACEDLCVNTGVTSMVQNGSCMDVTLEVACDTLCETDSLGCPGTTVLNFNQDPAGNPIPAGTIIGNQWASLGVTFSFVNNNPTKTAIGTLFDSSNPTGGDDDLGTPNVDFGGPGIGPGGGTGMPGVNDVALGNLLIIAENNIDSNNDGLIDDPDDEAAGGEMQMNFAYPFYVESLSIVDLDNGNGLIRVEQTGNRSTDFNIPGLGDNAVTTVPILLDSVVSVRVILPTSGGVSAVAFCPTGPAFMDISIPCGNISTFSNSADLPMQIISQDSVTGITGLRILGLPDCQDSLGQSSFTVSYRVCGLDAGCGTLCTPMVAYGQNGCVQYEMAGWGPVTAPPAQTPDKELPKVDDQGGWVGIYPNPMTRAGAAQLFLSRGGVAIAEVYDLFGNRMGQVFSGELQAEEMKEVEFEAGDWADGIYLLRMVTEGGRVYTSKFILAR